METIKKALTVCLCCCVVCLGLFLLAHRRVIAARLTGAEMPKAPAWHGKCCAGTCEEN
ncbi:MAG: hypothetical protein J5967_01910 [Oscillospiraceae bacterium]|nr:hypothetical protein [Oscillospiraceae bacterium]